MTPFPEAQPNTQEENFNQRHSSTRNTVERCIGVLKKRFRCLLWYRTLEYTPEKAAQIINACAVLHNMCTRARLPDPPEPADVIMALEEENNFEMQCQREGLYLIKGNVCVIDSLPDYICNNVNIICDVNFLMLY